MYKVVFTDDEEIHGDVTLQVSGRRKETSLVTNLRGSLAKPPAQVDRRTTLAGGAQQINVDIKEMMTASDWDKRFDQLFELYLIDVDDDYFDEEMPFKDPSQLEDKFETLEMENLMYVNRLQE